MTSYSNEEILAALGAAQTVGDVAEFLNIDIDEVPRLTKLKPMPDFNGFTAQDLEDWFNEENLLEDGWGETEYQLKNGTRYAWDKEVPITPFIHGQVAVEEAEKGREGGGEEIYMVFSVTDASGMHKRFFQKSGWYQSHMGSEWDGEFHEVWPKAVNVTRWVNKKP